MKIIKSSKGCKKRKIRSSVDDKLTFCPDCHSNRFNDKLGLCLDCGYDEKSWSTGPYYDQEYQDDYDDYDHDYEPANEDLKELQSSTGTYCDQEYEDDFDDYDHDYEPSYEDWQEIQNRVDSASSDTIYDRRETIIKNKHKYALRYTIIDNSPNADPQKMMDDFKFSISRVSPYDDANYAWCLGNQGKIRCYRDDSLIDTSFYMNADDMGVENTEWCDYIIQGAIDLLERLNHSIKPKIIHNSSNYCSRQTVIEASSNDTIKDLNDRLYSKASKYLKDNLDWDLKDIADMLSIDIAKIEDNLYRVQVRAELDYDWMFDLVKALDPIVEKYDRDAYFDMVEPGISEAYISTDTIQSSTQLDEAADWYKIDRKTVTDSDGFTTDYTWYANEDNTEHIFIFGDEDVYTPYNTEPDYETDSYETAKEWFDAYTGLYDDDDIYSAKSSGWDILPPNFLNSDLGEKFKSQVLYHLSKQYGQPFEVTKFTVKGNNIIMSVHSDDMEGSGNIKIDTAKYNNFDDILNYVDVMVKQLIDDIDWGSESITSATTTEYQPVSDTQYSINLQLDKVIINVDSNGDWTYADDNYPWAKSPDSARGMWYAHEYNNLYIADAITVVENFDSIVEPFIPGDPGEYQISCDAELVYDISDLDAQRTYYDTSDGSVDYDEDINADDADVVFNRNNSVVSNFVFSRVDK